MELNGKKLLHKKLGKGIIVNLDEKYIYIDFNGKTRQFALNSVFVNAISGDNEAVDEIKRRVNTLEEKNNSLLSEKMKAIENRINKAKQEVLNKTSSKINENLLNVAVRLVYCDGGKNRERVGFNGICSDELLLENVKANDNRWCTSPDCKCNIYAENKSTNTRRELDRLMEDDGFVCYESRMLRDWVTVADRTLTGLNTGEGKLCVLTTLEDGCEESERYIFAIYIIENIQEDINGNSSLLAEERYRYCFLPQDAKKMLFWDFVYTEDKEWGEDKFIYLSNEISRKILEKGIEITNHSRLKEMLDFYNELN